MTREEQRRYLIRQILADEEQYRDITILEDVGEQRNLLRALINVWQPGPAISASIKGSALRSRKTRRRACVWTPDIGRTLAELSGYPAKG